MRLSDAVNILSESGIPSPKYDASEIFKDIGGYSSSELLLSDPDTESAEVIDAVHRRAKREPLQYILGVVGFYKEEYEVSPACLIPRQDTEILVDYAVRNIPAGELFADLCTGSGCIGISVLANTSGTGAVLADISSDALDIAKRNASKNGVSDRVEFVLCDLMKEIPDGEFFAVLSNPPYVAESVYSGLEGEIFFEPREAFVAGGDGGDFYRHLVPACKTRIKPNGFIAFEIGYDQAKLLRSIAKAEEMSCEIIKDYSGNDRVAVLKRLK